jgi:hypothetical protein
MDVELDDRASENEIGLKLREPNTGLRVLLHTAD